MQHRSCYGISTKEGIDSAKGLMNDLLMPFLPAAPVEQKDFFEPHFGSLKKGDADWLKKYAGNLRRTLIFKNGLWPSGLLLFCLEYSRTSKYDVGGIFDAIKQTFSKFNETDLYAIVKAMTDFRNSYIAHQDKELTDIKIAKEGLAHWVHGICKIYFAHH